MTVVMMMVVAQLVLSPSTRLVFASPPDLRLETSLDSGNGTSRPAGLARHEENTVLLAEERVGRFAGLACHIFDYTRALECIREPHRQTRTDVTTKDVLDLLLLEATLDDQPTGAVHGTGGTHFCEHVLDNMLGLPVHPLADVGDVGKDRLLVPFSVDRGGRDGVPLSG